MTYRCSGTPNDDRYMRLERIEQLALQFGFKANITGFTRLNHLAEPRIWLVRDTRISDSYELNTRHLALYTATCLIEPSIEYASYSRTSHGHTQIYGLVICNVTTL